MRNEEHLTVDTITIEQIRLLREEARLAGDSIMAEICDLALAPHERNNADGTPLIGPAGGMVTRTGCRQVCVDAINAGRDARY